MSPRRKLIIGGLVLVQILLLAAMVAVIRPGATGGFFLFPPGIFQIGGVDVREPIEEETVTVGDAPEIIIRNDVGTVRVETGQAGVVTISGERVARGLSREDARQRLSDVVPRIRTTDNRVEIDAPAFTGIRRQDSINLVVQVPQQSRVTADAKMGSVRADGLTGDLTVDAGMGAVRVRDFQGNLFVNAGMGRIDVSNTEIQKELTLNADMGSVEFSGVPGDRNSLDAGMGSIVVALPRDTALNLNVQVGMGSFRSDLPLDGTQTERSYRGLLGQGEPTGSMEIDAGMGSVRIRER